MRTLARSVAPRQSGIIAVGSLVCMWNAMTVRPVLAYVLHLTALRPTASLNLRELFNPLGEIFDTSVNYLPPSVEYFIPLWIIEPPPWNN